MSIKCQFIDSFAALCKKKANAKIRNLKFLCHWRYRQVAEIALGELWMNTRRTQYII